MDCPNATTGPISRRLLCAALVCLAFAFTDCMAGPAAVTRGGTGPAPATAAPARAPVHGTPPATELQALSLPTLLDLALAAYKHGDLVAPASGNATGYYLAILQKDPHNRIALDALREMFPYAVSQIERTIQRRDYVEANREIALLALTDPTNYTLTILRGKLAGKSGERLTTTVAGAHVLTLRASTSSWIEIRDAAGRVVDSRVLRPGESRSYHLDGATRITLGNAGGVEATSDGKELPLGTDLRDKVMHLELFARS
jgi:hypothetical protein